MTNPPISTTPLADAQAWLQERIAEGATCPCCGQLAKHYQRKINAMMVRGLLEHYRLAPDKTWLDAAHLNGAMRTLDTTYPTSDYAKLRYWDLIEGCTEKGKKSHWRLTDKGIAFLHQQIKVPRFVVVYDSEIISFSTEMTDVVEALTDRFNYQELMGQVQP